MLFKFGVFCVLRDITSFNSAYTKVHFSSTLKNPEIVSYSYRKVFVKQRFNII